MKKRINIVICSLLMISFLLPSNAIAATLGKNESEHNVEKILQYVMVDENNNVYFDENKATNNNETEAFVEQCRYTRDLALSYLSTYTGQQTRVDNLPTIPVYGNWCGPSYGDGDPIDYLDAACMAHDNCYKDFGQYNCTCDQKLLDRINQTYHLMGTYEKQMADATKAAFVIIMMKNGC